MAFELYELFKYTEAKCAKEVIRILKNISPNSDPIYESKENQVRYKNNDNDGFIYLGNIYNHAKSKSKTERYEYLQGFLSSAIEDGEITYENSANLLIPRLKSKAEISIRLIHARRISATPQNFPSYDFTNSFVWELGIDSKSAIKIVSNEILEKLSLTKDTAMAIAKKNLYSITESNFFIEIENGLYLSRYDDDHDAARIMMTDVITNLEIKGNPVAFVPVAKVLMICGSEDVDVLNNIHTHIDKLSEGCRPLSRQPLILIDGKWQDYFPSKDYQNAGVINQVMIEVYHSYNEQKELINSIHESTNVDIFVASCMLLKMEDSPFYISTTTWSESVHAWIPKAETISFVAVDNGEAKLMGQVNFEDVLFNFPNLIKPLGYVPELYEVKDFPKRSQLEKLLITNLSTSS